MSNKATICAFVSMGACRKRLTGDAMESWARNAPHLTRLLARRKWLLLHKKEIPL